MTDFLNHIAEWFNRGKLDFSGISGYVILAAGLLVILWAVYRAGYNRGRDAADDDAWAEIHD